MKQEVIEHEILEEVMRLLEKSGLDTLASIPARLSADEAHSLESFLITLRNLNARYDKDDAVAHVKSLMQRYNIQLDELTGLPGIV